MAEIGEYNIENTGLFKRLLFPGLSQRSKYKKQAEFNRDIQQQQMNLASNNLTQMMQYGSEGFEEGGNTKRISLKEGLITDKNKSVNAPIPATTATGKKVTVHGGGELVVDAKRTSIMEQLLKGGNTEDLGSFVAETMKFYKERDGMMGKVSAQEGTANLGGEDPAEKIKRILNEKNKINDNRFQYNYKGYKSRIEQLDKELEEASKELKAKGKDAESTRIDKREKEYDARVAEQARIDKREKEFDAKFPDFGKEKKATPSSKQSTVGQPTSIKPDQLPEIDKSKIEDPGLLKQEFVTPDIAQGQKALELRVQEPAVEGAKTPEGEASSNDQALYDMINKTYQRNTRSNVAKQIANALFTARQMGKQFRPESIPQRRADVFIPNLTDTESIKQAGEDKITQGIEKAKRTLEESGRTDLLVGLSANELEAQKELGQNITQIRSQILGENKQGLMTNLNRNADIDYQNAVNIANAASAFNQAKEQALASGISTGFGIADVQNVDRTRKDSNILNTWGLLKGNKLQQEYQDYISGKKKESEIGTDITSDLPKIDQGIFGNIFKNIFKTQ